MESKFEMETKRMLKAKSMLEHGISIKYIMIATASMSKARATPAHTTL